MPRCRDGADLIGPLIIPGGANNFGAASHPPTGPRHNMGQTDYPAPVDGRGP